MTHKRICHCVGWRPYRARINLFSAFLLLQAVSACTDPPGTPPIATVDTGTCQWYFNRTALQELDVGQIFVQGCPGSVALDNSGRRLAVSGVDGIGIFNVESGERTTLVSGRADKLLGSPSGEFFIAENPNGDERIGALRILRFDSGETAFRTNDYRTGLSHRSHFDPWRDGGGALEVSSDVEYRNVTALYWRKGYQRTYTVSPGLPESDRTVGPLAMMSVSNDLGQTAWWDFGARAGQKRLLFASDERGVGWAPGSFPEFPAARAFSDDGSTFVAELDGRVVGWNASSGQIIAAAGDEAKRCALWRSPAFRSDGVVIVCRHVDGDGRINRFQALLVPGMLPLAELVPTPGSAIRYWQISLNGLRLVIVEEAVEPEGQTGAEAPWRFRLFNVANGREMASIVPSPDFAGLEDDLSLSADGRRLAARRSDGVVQVFEVRD